MAATSQKPQYGRRLIPHLIDEIAELTPDRVYCSITRSTDVRDGFEDITYMRLANAITRTAWWIRKTLGETKEFETLGYLGPSDLRYIVLTIAAQKAHYKVSQSLQMNQLVNLFADPIPGVFPFASKQRRSKFTPGGEFKMQYILDHTDRPACTTEAFRQPSDGSSRDAEL